MSARRRICVVTGSRAEYGLLRWLMAEIQADPDCELQVVATCMHLSPEFGLTWKRIEEDGFPIAEKVEMLLSSDSPVAISKSMGLGQIGLADAYSRLRPDLVILLGDRFETLSAAAAAAVARIPLAHIHGGELTEGAVDDVFRHAVTKMSHLHFTSAEAYRHRVIQMGEAPERVFNVGALGLDGIRKVDLLSRDALGEAMGFPLRARNLLVTFHPATLEGNVSAHQFRQLLEALESVPDAGIILTKANADAHGRIINDIIDEYAATRPDRVCAFASLGQQRYLSALKAVDAVVGNSSSGLLEAPGFGTPTVNIGDRQKGRLRAASVVDCAPETGAIRVALARALSPEFRLSPGFTANPYGDGRAAERIMAVLRRPLPSNLLQKTFHDLRGT